MIKALTLAAGLSLALAGTAFAGSFSVTSPSGDVQTFINQNEGLTGDATSTLDSLAGGSIAGVSVTPDPSTSSGFRVTVTLTDGTTISTGSVVVGNLLVSYFS